MGLKMKGMKFGNEHMKNQAPMMSNNYSKSGLNPNSGDGPPFLGKIFGGAKKLLGGAAKFGAFGPLGMMAQMMMKKRKAKQAAQQQQAQAVAPPVQEVPGAVVGADAPMGSEGDAMPNPEELGTN